MTKKKTLGNTKKQRAELMKVISIAWAQIYIQIFNIIHVFILFAISWLDCTRKSRSVYTLVYTLRDLLQKLPQRTPTSSHRDPGNSQQLVRKLPKVNQLDKNPGVYTLRIFVPNPTVLPSLKNENIIIIIIMFVVASNLIVVMIMINIIIITMNISAIIILIIKFIIRNTTGTNWRVQTIEIWQ